MAPDQKAPSSGTCTGRSARTRRCRSAIGSSHRDPVVHPSDGVHVATCPSRSRHAERGSVPMNVYRDHVSEPAGADSSRNANGGRRILANAETAVSVSTRTSRQTGTSVPDFASSLKRSNVTISTNGGQIPSIEGLPEPARADLYEKC